MPDQPLKSKLPSSAPLSATVVCTMRGFECPCTRWRRLTRRTHETQPVAVDVIASIKLDGGAVPITITRSGKILDVQIRETTPAEPMETP